MAGLPAQLRGLRPVPAGRSWAADLGVAVLLAGVYVAGAKAAFALAVVQTSIAPIWPPSGIALAAVLLGVIALWICESVPIPIGGLIGVAAVVLLGIAPPDEVLAPFGSTTVFTFIGVFIIAPRGGRRRSCRRAPRGRDQDHADRDDHHELA